VLKYSLSRLVLFAVCFGLAWLGFSLASPDHTVDQDQVLFALLIGALVSMALSWVLLKRMREDISDRINERVAARTHVGADGQATDRRSVDELAEDAEADRP